MTPAIINIVSAERVGGYRIHIRFDDETEQTVDLEPFLKHSIHPDIRAYLDEAHFAAFRLDHGELVWGDYDLCFPIIDLYRNTIIHNNCLETAAVGRNSTTHNGAEHAR